MKIAMNLTMLLLLALQGEMAKASFDDYQRFRRGTYDFAFETRYEKTTANYLSSGNSFRALPYDQSFELLNFNLLARYDMSRRSSWYSQLGIASATSYGLDARRTNSSLTDATFGYAYLIYSDAFEMITDFSVLAPFNKVSENTDTALNNEGVIQVTGLLRIQKEFSWLATYSYVGAQYRQSRSALVPWAVGAENVSSSWLVGGKVFGYQSITDDADTSTKSQRLIVNDRVDGGSLKFYAVNPSWIDSEVYLKFKSQGGLTFAGGLGTTLTGTSYAAGMHATLGLMYTWDSEPSYYLKNSTSEDGLGSERKVKKFKEEIDDGVDQKLFQKKKAAPPSGGSMKAEPAEPGVTLRRTEPRQANADAEVQDPAQDAAGRGMQIKLKKAKRRRKE